MEELNADYIRRLNKVFTYIDNHLDTELSLETVAEVAHYSPFHFHRIFKVMTDETLNSYITRQRIEKSASILLHHDEVPISAIHLKYGFTSNSSFTRTFKKYYGISPTEFRKQSPSKYSKIRQVDSKNGQENGLFEEYICNINNHKNWMNMNANIEIKETPKMEFAYITQIGIQGLSNAFERLMKWAAPRGLMSEPDFKMATIYYDSFKVTAPNKVRMNACILLNEPVEKSGEVGLTMIEKGKCIVGSYEIQVHEFEKAWTGLFIWMNENGYQKSDQNPFEIYHNDFNSHPEKKCTVDLYIPVK